MIPPQREQELAPIAGQGEVEQVAVLDLEPDVRPCQLNSGGVNRELLGTATLPARIGLFRKSHPALAAAGTH